MRHGVCPSYELRGQLPHHRMRVGHRWAVNSMRMIFGTLLSSRIADVERKALERPLQNRFPMIAAAVIVTWLPLLLMTLWDGTAFGDRVLVSFLVDRTPHGRYLIALPLLLWMGPFLVQRTRVAIDELFRSGVVMPAHEHEPSELHLEITRAWHNPLALLAIVVLSYAAAMPALLWAENPQHSSWMFQTGSLSMAGAWNLLFGAPLVRALIFYNLWRLLVWIWLLARISRRTVDLNALHFDGRGGLKFLGESQIAFAPLIAALGIQLGCALTVAMRFENLGLPMLQLVLATFAALAVTLLLAPLLMFSRHLWFAKQRAEAEFSVWSAIATTHLTDELRDARPEKVIAHLDTGEISSVTDAAALFDRVHAIRLVPIDVRTFILVLASAIVPAVLPLATLLPATELISRLAGVVL